MPQNRSRHFNDIAAHDGLLAALAVFNTAVVSAVPLLVTVFFPSKERVGKAIDRIKEVSAEHVAEGASMGVGVSWLAYAGASDPDQLSYDLSFWRAGLSLTGSAFSTWLLFRRSIYSLPVSVGTSAVTVGLGLANQKMTGHYVTPTWEENSAREEVFNKLMPGGHLVALAVQSIATVASAGRLTSGVVTPEALDKPLFSGSWYPLVRKLALYYMVFSLVGHWGEMLFCTGIKHGIFKGEYDRSNRMLWDQWLFPFPAEGSAAVIAALGLLPLKGTLEKGFGALALAGSIPVGLAKPLAFCLSFLVNQVVCTAIDYVTGLVANQNYELWDYRDMPFNYRGQICLQNSLFYSAAATLGVWGLLPPLERLMAVASNTALDGTLVGLGSFYLFLELLYHVLPRDVEAILATLQKTLQETADEIATGLAEGAAEQA